MSIIPIIFGAIGIGVILIVYIELPYRAEKKRQEEFEKKYQEERKRKMKWINEKTVQGEPDDIKKYCIPKEEHNIPTVNEGIQEGRKLIFCKDCKYCDRHHLVDGLFCYRLYENYNREYPQMIIEVDADDFCSRGERK